MIKWKFSTLLSAFALGGGAGTVQQPSSERGPVPPRLIAGSISNMDYPVEAIRAREQGSVRITISIGVDGSVTDCVVSESSGSRSLDERSCALARERFRYSPGRNAAGIATPSIYRQSVRWVLPDVDPVPFAPSLTVTSATVRDGQITACTMLEDGEDAPLPMDECQELFRSYPAWESMRGALASATHVFAFTPNGSPPPATRPEWGELHERFELDILIGPGGQTIGCAPPGASSFSPCPPDPEPSEPFDPSSEAERRGRFTYALFTATQR